MAQQKPDLCAPSQFSETDNAFAINSGTSAACGLTAGVVAALRTRRRDLPPADLKAILLDNARGSTPPAWDHRLGFGIIDAEAACNAALPADV